jgi:hypothetical protein
MQNHRWFLGAFGLLLLAPALIGGAATLQDPKATHDLVIEIPSTLTPGTQAAARISVFASTGLFDFKPASGSPVRLVLIDGKGLAKELFADRTDARGTVAASFAVPDLPEGEYALEITTESAAGKDVRTQKVRLARGYRILLTSDKPLYQPGQTIHLRALSLEALTLRPVAGQEILFEIEDAKSNKLFKRRGPTSEFGVAALDFQLADELNMGAWKVVASIGESRVEKSIEVKKYVLPKFKVSVSADKKFYRPLETVKGTIEARYFFGKAVEGGDVRVTASTFDAQLREFAKLDLKTNESGQAEFELKLPDYFVGQPLDSGNAFVSLDVQVLDKAEHTERASQRITVCSRPVLLTLLPESGRLIGGVENVVYAVASSPNGEPVEADLAVQIAGLKKEVRTGAAGHASFVFTPRKEDLRGEQDWNTGRMKYYFDASIAVRLKGGESVTIPLRLDAEADAEGMLLRADKALYRTGETIALDLFSRNPTGMAFVDVIRRGQTHSSHVINLERGRGRLSIPIPQDLFGTLEIHAYRLSKEGEISRDTRVLFVEQAQDLRIAMTADRPEYRPGTEAKIRFQVTDAGGRGVQAALGVMVIDEAVYAMQEMQPGLEKVYFMLEQELSKPRVDIKFGGGIPGVIGAREPGQQEVAKILLANVEIPARRARVNTLEERFANAKQSVAQAYQGVLSYAGSKIRTPDAVTRKNPFTDKRELRPDLVDRMASEWKHYAQFIRDPWGKPISLETIEKSFQINLFESLTRAHSADRLHAIFNAMTQEAPSDNLVERAGAQWVFRKGLLESLIQKRRISADHTKDCWGDAITLERLPKLSPAFEPANIAKLVDDERRAGLFEHCVSHLSGGGQWSDDLVRKVAASMKLPAAAVRSLETGKEFDIRELSKERPEFAREILEAQAKIPQFQQAWNTILETVRKDGLRAVATLTDQGWKLKDNLTRLQPELLRFYPQHLDPNLLAMTALMRNWNDLANAARAYCRNNGLWERRGNRLTPPADLVEKLLEGKLIAESTLRDPYGDRTRVEIDLNKRFVQWNVDLRHVEFTSAGPDGKYGTADDIRFSAHNYQGHDHIAPPNRTAWYQRDGTIHRNVYGGWGEQDKVEFERAGDMDFRHRGELVGRGGGGGGRPGPGGMPVPEGAPPAQMAQAVERSAAKGMDANKGSADKPQGGGGGFQEPARVREWFPETLFWKPELITDAQGRAEIALPIADSITTWRLTCSANSKSCLLGSATSPIRVFQDFFADIDFPVGLTRNDLVWVPVAVFNYLQEAQTVRLTVEKESWFDLEDAAEKIVELGANEIKAVHFKIRARQVGRHALTIKASGTKLADALKRSVEVVPDGKRFEQVVNDRLPRRAAHTFEIPSSAIEGGSKILFKVYPGVLAQIMDGLDSMLRLPGG